MQRIKKEKSFRGDHYCLLANFFLDFFLCLKGLDVPTIILNTTGLILQWSVICSFRWTVW